MSEEIESRLRALEDHRVAAKAVKKWLIGIGFTGSAVLAGLIAFAFYGFNKVQTFEKSLNALEARRQAETVEASALSTAANSAILGIESKVDESTEQALRRLINTELLLKGFASGSVLGQIQAQSVCATMEFTRAQTMERATELSGTSTKPRFAKAVFRSKLGRAPFGSGEQQKDYSEPCQEICKSVLGAPNAQPLEFIGALHIYDDQKPFDFRAAHNGHIFQGLGTYLYNSEYTNRFFGPNYCCCAG